MGDKFHETVRNLLSMKPKPHYEAPAQAKGQSSDEDQPSSKRATKLRNSGEDRVRPPIGKALAFRVLDDQGGALSVIYPVGSAVAVAESELCGVAVQVLLSAVLIVALHAALEDAKITFNDVGGHVAAHIFFRTMVDGLVSRKMVAQVVILHGFVGVDRGFLGDVRLEDRQKRCDLEVIDHNRLGTASRALNQSQDFILCPTPRRTGLSGSRPVKASSISTTPPPESKPAGAVPVMVSRMRCHMNQAVL